MSTNVFHSAPVALPICRYLFPLLLCILACDARADDATIALRGAAQLHCEADDAAARRAIPLTAEARQQMAAMRRSMPEDWHALGQVRPRSAKTIQYSLLGIGGEVLDRDFANFHAYKDYLEPLGAKRIRLQSGWAKTEKERSVYDFTWLDQIIDGSLQRGIDPWLQLSYGNLIYPDAGGTGLGQGLIQSAEGLAAWDRYVIAAVRRYADKVTYYEIWNEADIKQHGQDSSEVTTQAYPKLFVRTAEIIRREDPEAFILGLALANVGQLKTVEVFMTYLAQRRKLHLLDGISFHGYPVNPDHNFDHVARIRELVDRHAPGVVLWQGETGAPSARQPQFALSKRDWTELSQAKWNTRRALAHIGRNIPFSQFQISDMYYKQTRRNTLNTKGLLQAAPDLSITRPKLAYYAYQHVCSLFCDGLIPEGQIADVVSSNESLAAFSFYHALKGRHAVALWDSSGKPGESMARVRTSITIPSCRMSNPVYVDLLSGSVYAIPKSSIAFNGMQVTLNDILIWDAPVVVTDAALVAIMQ